MALVDIEVGVTEQERAIADTVHKFAEEVMRPAGVELDRLADPADIKTPDSVLWEVFKKHRELGLDDPLDSADSEIGPVETARIRCIINEELGWGDSGLAISLGSSSRRCPVVRS
jgi:acyl-CoA dehydrogenase